MLYENGGLCPFSREKNWHKLKKCILNMASSDSQIDKPQPGRPKRTELPDVNINTGAQSINAERASNNIFFSSNSSVEPGIWDQVLDLYPCLVDCSVCSSTHVRRALREALREYADLLSPPTRRIVQDEMNGN